MFYPFITVGFDSITHDLCISAVYPLEHVPFQHSVHSDQGSSGTLLSNMERNIVQKKNTRLSYSTLKSGLTKAIFTTVAGIHSSPSKIETVKKSETTTQQSKNNKGRKLTVLNQSFHILILHINFDSINTSAFHKSHTHNHRGKQCWSLQKLINDDFD